MRHGLRNVNCPEHPLGGSEQFTGELNLGSPRQGVVTPGRCSQIGKIFRYGELVFVVPSLMAEAAPSGVKVLSTSGIVRPAEGVEVTITRPDRPGATFLTNRSQRIFR